MNQGTHPSVNPCVTVMARGISAGNNSYFGTAMTTAQAAQAKQCNQALYDAARNHPDAPGSKAVQWWMVNGSHLPGGTYILYPGTEAVPW